MNHSYVIVYALLLVCLLTCHVTYGDEPSGKVDANHQVGGQGDAQVGENKVKTDEKDTAQKIKVFHCVLFYCIPGFCV